MNREEKITKLCNAIRAYRGMHRDGKWVYAPQPGKRDDVWSRLSRMDMNLQQVASAMAAVDGFQSYKDMQVWVQETFRPEKQS